jgi:hypothetical protein
MSEPKQSDGPSKDVVERVTATFLIHTADSLILGPPKVEPYLEDCINDAFQGLRSVIRAATLPFQLTLEAVHQRRFDRILTSERIRSLKSVAPGEPPLPEALVIARQRMKEFTTSIAGQVFVRDSVVHDLHRSLTSNDISAAAAELMVQTLVSTWAVFEHFATSFIVRWVDQDPKRSRSILSAADLKTYLGKQVVDIDAIDEQGFDLTRAMGTVIFREKRLDNLAVIRSVLNALFNDSDIRVALGDDLWLLNQRRHLFVHKRGLVDQEYLKRTGDNVPPGKRLRVSSADIERYILAVQQAIIAITNAANRESAVAYSSN